MGRGKDDFIAATGGFRADEGDEQRTARLAEIVQLEREFRATIPRGLAPEAVAERERIQRRLCELKGENFDDYDGPRDDD